MPDAIALSLSSSFLRCGQFSKGIGSVMVRYSHFHFGSYLWSFQTFVTLCISVKSLGILNQYVLVIPSHAETLLISELNFATKLNIEIVPVRLLSPVHNINKVRQEAAMRQDSQVLQVE